jgi:hypothetical protein
MNTAEVAKFLPRRRQRRRSSRGAYAMRRRNAAYPGTITITTSWPGKRWRFCDARRIDN